MQLIEYYHRLHTELPEARAGLPVTLERLSGIFYCSERNVKFILHKMAGQGWIVWKPGRGRGNHSELALLEDSSALLRKEAMRLVQEGNIRLALELVGLPGMEPGERESFFQWLGGAFGYQEVDSRERPLEILRLPYYAPILTMDPARMVYAKDMHLVRQLFDTLVRFDLRTGRVAPHLAHHWERTPDGKCWTFYLRKGVRFHHGRELAADDAAFSLKRLQQGRHLPNYWMVRGIADVRVLGTYVLQVELSEPNYMFDQYAGAAGLSIVPRDLYDREGVPAPVGTGSFRLLKYDASMCILEAFPDYFRERALLDRVELWMLPAGSQAAMAMQLQSSEWLTDRLGSGTDLSGEVSAEPAAGQLPGFHYLSFNVEWPGPHRSRKFREAVHLLIDRWELIRDTGKEGCIPAQSMLPDNGESGRTAEPGGDAVLGKRLLEESGYGGEPLELMLSDSLLELGEWLVRRLGRFGIIVKLKLLRREEAAELKWMSEAPCYLGGLAPDEDTDIFLLELFQAGRYSGFFLPENVTVELEKQVGLMLREPCAEKRRLLLMEMEEIIHRDRHVVILLHKTSRFTHASNLRGVTVNSLGQVDFKDLWFQPETFSQDSPSRRQIHQKNPPKVT